MREALATKATNFTYWPTRLSRVFNVASLSREDASALLEQVYTASRGLVDMWEQRCALLERFRGREGNADVPIKHVEDGVKLGVWLGVQRTAFKAGKLSAERRGRLESLGVRWGFT